VGAYAHAQIKQRTNCRILSPLPREREREERGERREREGERGERGESEREREESEREREKREREGEKREGEREMRCAPKSLTTLHTHQSVKMKKVKELWKSDLKTNL
jgi:hypothetical protein